MIEFIFWYLVVTLIGLAAFPLLFTLLPGLPGRGYGFSRAAGLLLWGYGYWLLASFNLTLNDLGGAVLAFGALVLLGVWAWRREGQEAVRTWASRNRGHIIAVEVLFLGGFALWALVRSANPELFGTEKPMELAFINAILKSPELPPRDPWLSGYAISYYYFGYLMTASLARLTGVLGSVAFNLAISMVFAMGAVGAYTLVYDILSAGKSDERAGDGERGAQNLVARRAIQPFALLAPVFVLVLSNLVGLLEVLHARGVLWFRDAAGELTSPVWQWIDLQELSRPPSEPFGWLPRNFGVGSWWWWRASRVVQDYDLGGNWREVIDEFPFFSFLLGDLHPHVLAIPFVFLGMALALNLYLGGASGRFRVLGFRANLSLPSFLFAAVILGGLAFLNIWDFPTFLILFAAAYALMQINRYGMAWRRLGEFFGILLLSGVAGYLVYLPWHLSFASQARGILPNLVYPTRGVHLWIMFGLFLVPLFGFLIYCYKNWGSRSMFFRGTLFSAGMLAGLFLFSILLGAIILGFSALP
ncbi:MAG: DUF2298 domain-containing protein, partial [Anaerolineales bacterium]|nr:DUF2298 domain-containing protein [Anaerolineales bacterium]